MGRLSWLLAFMWLAVAPNHGLAIQQPERPIDALIADFDALEARKAKSAAGSEARAIDARAQAALAGRIGWRFYAAGRAADAGDWFQREAAARSEGASAWLALLDADLGRLDQITAALTPDPAAPGPWKDALVASLEVTARANRSKGFDAAALEKQAETFRQDAREIGVEARPLVLTFIDSAVIANRDGALMLASDLPDRARIAGVAADHVRRRRARLDVLMGSGRPAGDREIAAARTQLARALRAFGSIERDAGQYAIAEKRYVEALDVERQVPEDFEGREIAETLTLLAEVHRDTGQLDRAEARFREALTELSRLASRPVPPAAAPAAAALNASRLDQTTTLLALGKLQVSRGEYNAALQTYADALEHFDVMAARLKVLAADHRDVAQIAERHGVLRLIIRAEVAAVYAESGDAARAIRELDAIDLDAMMQRDDTSDIVSAILLGKARFEATQTNPAGRANALSALLRYYQATGNLTGVVATELRLASLLSTAQPDAAAAHAHTALSLARHPREIVRAATSLAQIHLDGGRPQDARPLTSRWSNRQILTEPRLEAATLVIEGRLAEADGNLPTAIARYERAIDRVESLQASLTAGDGFFDVRVNHEPYERLISVLVRQKRLPDALEYITRQQVREVRDAGAIHTLRSTDRAVQDLLDRAVAIRTHIQRLSTAATTASVWSIAAPDQQAGNIDRALAGRVEEWRQVTDAIRSRDPDLGTYFTPHTSGLAAARQTLPSDTAIVVFAAPMDTALYMFVLTRDGERIYESPLRPGDIWELVKRFRGAMDVQTASGPGIEALVQLYDALISPIEPAIRGARRLLVLPTRALHYVPLQALARKRSGGVTFLVEDKEIVYLASGRHSARTDPHTPRSTVTVFANPTGDLPMTEREAEAIRAIFPGATVLSGDRATKDAVRDPARPDSDILHFAAHGYLIPAAPTTSYLALAGSSPDDRRLSVGEIRGLPLDNVKLVTLSVCDTARAQDDPRGVELTTMSDAFLSAGADAVVGTFWRVPDDNRTVSLVSRFYRELAAGSCEATALRAAQMAALRTPGASDPYGWASFAVFRSWSSTAASGRCR